VLLTSAASMAAWRGAERGPGQLLPQQAGEEEATLVGRIIFQKSKRKHEQQYSTHQTSSADGTKRISSDDRIKKQ
jgi:hypothetical protein